MNPKKIPPALCRLLLVFALLAAFSSFAYAYTVPSNTIVYVTYSGEKYHREGCSYLKSARRMTIERAVSLGYKPCSRCRPDRLTGEYTTDYVPGSGLSGAKTSSGQGTSSSPGSGYSYRGMLGMVSLPGLLLAGACFSAAAISSVIFCLRSKKKGMLRQAGRKERLHFLELERQDIERYRAGEQARCQEDARRRASERKWAGYVEMYSGKTAQELAGMPSWAETGPDGLPMERGADSRDDLFPER